MAIKGNDPNYYYDWDPSELKFSTDLTPVQIALLQVMQKAATVGDEAVKLVPGALQADYYTLNRLYLVKTVIVENEHTGRQKGLSFTTYRAAACLAWLNRHKFTLTALMVLRFLIEQPSEIGTVSNIKRAVPDSTRDDYDQLLTAELVLILPKHTFPASEPRMRLGIGGVAFLHQLDNWHN